MKTTSEQLVDDLLGDAAPPNFRAEVLDAALRSARRRQRVRRHFNVALIATAAAGVFLFSFWKTREPAAAPGLIIVDSQPLDPSQIVVTRPDSVEIVATSASTGPYHEINDKQLLTLLFDRSPFLVHRGQAQSELIVLK